MRRHGDPEAHQEVPEVRGPADQEASLPEAGQGDRPGMPRWPIFGQNWPSFGQRLATFGPNFGQILAKNGQILVWPNFGQGVGVGYGRFVVG